MATLWYANKNVNQTRQHLEKLIKLLYFFVTDYVTNVPWVLLPVNHGHFDINKTKSETLETFQNHLAKLYTSSVVFINKLRTCTIIQRCGPYICLLISNHVLYLPNLLYNS